MTHFDGVSLRAGNLKCFAEAHGFDRILPMNIIIGRNNSGKSTLLDMLTFATKPDDISALGHRGKPPEVFLTCALTPEFIEKAFPDQHVDYNEGNSGVKFMPRRIALQHLAQKRVTVKLERNHVLSDAYLREDRPIQLPPVDS